MPATNTPVFTDPLEGMKYYSSVMDYVPLGLPSDPVSLMPPSGLESTVAAQGTTPMLSSVQGIWNTITTDSESAYQWFVTPQGENPISFLYGKGKEAISTVVDDIAKPAGNLLEGVYWKLLLAVVVIGGVVYFAGKSGAVRISR